MMNRRHWIKTSGSMAGAMMLGPQLSWAQDKPQDNDIHLQPQWDQGTAIRHTWAGLGNVDQLRWITRRDMQDQLALCHKELGLKHVRAVGAFDDDLWVLSRDPAQYFNKDRSIKEGTRINWRTPLYIYDSLVSLGLSPVVTPCFTPTEMASGEKTVFRTRNNVTPPADWKAWERVVSDFIRALVDRYGIETLKTWYFEAWNEPNLDGFWTGGKEGYWQLYRVLHDVIKSIDPGLRIGGPSTARGEWIQDILEFGQKNDCTPDYMIGHCYNNDSAAAPLSPFDGPQKDKENRSPNFTAGVVRGITKILRDNDFRGEFHMNEWGLSWYPYNPVRETANEAAFIIKTMNEVSQEADYFAYWCLSDIYNQVGYGREAFHGNYGMLSMDGLRKPNYFAHQLLNRLGQEKVPVAGKGTSDLVNAFATKSSDAYQVMVYAFDINYQAGNAPGKCAVTLDLPGGIDPATARIYRLDDDHNNILKSWNEMGNPAIPTARQLDRLRQENELGSEKAGNLIKRFKKGYQAVLDMPNPGVVLLEVDKR